MLLSKVLYAIAAAGLAASFPLTNSAASGSDLSTDIANAIANSAFAGNHASPVRRTSYSFTDWQYVDIGSVLSVSPSTLSTSAKTGTYKVVSGDTGSKIATKLGVSVTALANANPLVNWGNMFVGQAISIPGSSSVPGNADNSNGQMINAIAGQLGVSAVSLAAANPGLDWYSLAAGQQINVPQTDGTTNKYTLMFGDMGQTIATTLGISYAKLVAGNPNIDFNNLQPGDQILVPADVKQQIDPDDGSDAGSNAGDDNTSDAGSDSGDDTSSDTSSNAGDDDDNASDAGSDTSSNNGGEDNSDSYSDSGSTYDGDDDGTSSYGGDDGTTSQAGDSDAGSSNGEDDNYQSDDGSDGNSEYDANESDYSDSDDQSSYRRVRRGLYLREPTTYMVEDGETLDEIALRLGVLEAYLEQANPDADFSDLQAGEVLNIPTASALHTPDM